MKVGGDLGRARVEKRRSPIRGAQGAESAPIVELAPEREALIDQGIHIFSRRYGRTIGREEGRQMIERLTAFFRLLDEWEHREHGGPVEGEAAA